MHTLTFYTVFWKQWHYPHTHFHYHSATHPILQVFTHYIRERHHRVRDTPSYAPVLNLDPLIGYLKWYFHCEFGDFLSGVMQGSDLLAHDAMSTVNGFHCFEGKKNASWTTWALKMKAPRTFETSCALHPSRCSVVTSRNLRPFHSFPQCIQYRFGPRWKKILRVPNMGGPANSTYTKSERLTLSCGGTWAGSERAN